LSLRGRRWRWALSPTGAASFPPTAAGHAAIPEESGSCMCLKNSGLGADFCGLGHWPPSCTSGDGGERCRSLIRRQRTPHVIPEDGMRLAKVGCALFAAAFMLLVYGGSKPQA